MGMGVTGVKHLMHACKNCGCSGFEPQKVEQNETKTVNGRTVVTKKMVVVSNICKCNHRKNEHYGY